MPNIGIQQQWQQSKLPLNLILLLIFKKQPWRHLINLISKRLTDKSIFIHYLKIQQNSIHFYTSKIISIVFSFNSGKLKTKTYKVKIKGNEGWEKSWQVKELNWLNSFFATLILVNTKWLRLILMFVDIFRYHTIKIF